MIRAEPRTFAIVLAAGAATRFGATKQLQEYRGEPLVRRSMHLAEAVFSDRSVLVTGGDWRAVFSACKPLHGFLVHNSSYRTGIAGSIASGVRAVAEVADAVVLMLADQPLITREHLAFIVDEWDGSAEKIVATAFAGTAGPPVIFPARYFSQLAALTGDQGARAILAEAAAHVQQVTFEPAAVDIDTPADLQGLP